MNTTNTKPVPSASECLRKTIANIEQLCRMVNNYSGQLGLGKKVHVEDFTEYPKQAQASLAAENAALREALELQLERMEWACKNVLSEETARWMQKSLQDMRSALSLSKQA